MDINHDADPHAHQTAFVDAARAAAGTPDAPPPAATPNAPPAPQPPVAPPSAPAAAPPPGPTASIPAAPSGSPAAAPSAAAKSLLKELAAAEGYDVSNFDSDDVLAKAMFARLKTLENQYKQAIAQASPAAAQPQPAAQPVPADDEEPEWDEESYFSEQWGAPAIDPALQSRFEKFVQAGIIVRDERTGEYTANAGDELLAKPVLDAVGSALEARNSRAREFVSGNPLKQAWQAFQEPLNRREEAILARVEAMLSQRNAVESFEKQHAGTLFTTGPDGKRTWSDTGLAWKAAVDKFRAAGVSDPQALLALAGEFVLPHLAAAPKPTIPPLSPAAPAAAAPATPAAVSQQKQESFLETAARAAGHQPQSSSYVAAGAGPGSGPVEVEERELADFFVRRNGQGVHVG